MSPLDLHVLGTPPAFVLSQDQTLPFNPSTSLDALLFGIFAVSVRSLALLFLCAFLLCIVFKVRCAPSGASAPGRARLIYQTHIPLSSTFFQKNDEKVRKINVSGRCLSSLCKTFVFWFGFQLLDLLIVPHFCSTIQIRI